MKSSQDSYCAKAKAGEWSSLSDTLPTDLKWEALVDVLRGKVKVCSHIEESRPFTDARIGQRPHLRDGTLCIILPVLVSLAYLFNTSILGGLYRHRWVEQRIQIPNRGVSPCSRGISRSGGHQAGVWRDSCCCHLRHVCSVQERIVSWFRVRSENSK